MTPPDPNYRPMEECDHRNLSVIDDAEGNLDEARLTRHFTLYDCPDCEYAAESPPPGWEPDFEEPYDPDEPPQRHY